MLTLYHMPVAICAQKVRVCLAEKGVEWGSVDMTGKLRSSEYLKLNPNGYVPTLVHEGRVITESRIISEYIDETFEGPALQPKDTYWRSVMRRWSKQIDDSLHNSIFLLTFVPFFRDRLLQLPEEQRAAAIPLDPIKAERTRNLLELGWKSPYIEMSLRRFATLIADMEATLTETEWLAGDSYSLADADLTPYFQRLEDLGLDWLWADRLAVGDWHARVRNRPSFSTVVAEWFTREERAATAERGEEIGLQFRTVMDAAKAIA